jgi:hypothetical protein
MLCQPIVVGMASGMAQIGLVTTAGYESSLSGCAVPRSRFLRSLVGLLAAAMSAVEANPAIRMVEVRRATGLSTKRLIGLFRAGIGLPTEFARVRRANPAIGRRCSGLGFPGRRSGFWGSTWWPRLR